MTSRPLRIDCHVHVSAFTAGRGRMSPHVLRTLPFRFMRWRLGFTGADATTEEQVATRMAHAIAEARATDAGGAPVLDAAVVLAFDAVYTHDGRVDEANTHLHVENDYAAELARRIPGALFGASVHPYRRDAVAELERCIADGAVLLKWLPITQGIDPTDRRCHALYEVLAHHGVPLLSHTGGERTLPNVSPGVASPLLLEPALARGVKVIAAHCGTRSAPSEQCHLADFVRMAHEHEHLYGDTAALCLPTRDYAFPTILDDPLVRARLVHGSDWPVVPLPNPQHVGWWRALGFLGDRNWIRRDVRIKRALGFGDDYWERAAGVLRLPAARAA